MMIHDRRIYTHFCRPMDHQLNMDFKIDRQYNNRHTVEIAIHISIHAHFQLIARLDTSYLYNYDQRHTLYKSFEKQNSHNRS